VTELKPGPRWKTCPLAICLLALPALTVAETVTRTDINRLISRLDHRSFTLRQQAQARLLEIGLPALPALVKASESRSRDQRYRIEQLLADIQHRALHKGFVEILSVKRDGDIDLEAGMALISRILDPMADGKAVARRLDTMAAQVRKRLGNLAPERADPPTLVAALVHVLNVEQGLQGNVDDYDKPRNSSLGWVLESRKGLPIVLSHIAILVAQRLDVPIVGLGVPGRYMIQYDAPGKQADLIIDPFGDWTVVTPPEVKQISHPIDPEKDLVPDTHRNALSRMLRNLISDYTGTGQADKAGELNAYLLLVDGPEVPGTP
jgi:regulator of sirC expression with transglutaminase-like and TPR domain